MQKKYPENIDNIEEFYGREFENMQVEPSEGVWTNIVKSIDHNNQIVKLHRIIKISISINILFIFISMLIYFNPFERGEKNKAHPSVNTLDIDNFSEENEIAPIIINENKSKSDSYSIKEQINSKEQKSEIKISTNNRNKEINPENPEDDRGIKERYFETEAVFLKKEDREEKEQIKIIDEQVSGQVEKSVDFFQKYSESRKDSLRPLFIPVK